ncbi:uncharacterized protein LOC126298330 [Schistocerca gregaria]|uniref:uncharacterized protein LOC126298330 n=1 Tax=Schistocerca gregaria TaxID=7010 RepID=UPI00211ED257|nr:uncharacterized protein LOC126298330 [Schistocerca gregaria]
MIQALTHVFVTEGLSWMITPSNGTQFTSAVFQDFCVHNSIAHHMSIALHSQSNGETEGMVHTFQMEIKKRACTAKVMPHTLIMEENFVNMQLQSCHRCCRRAAWVDLVPSSVTPVHLWQQSSRQLGIPPFSTDTHSTSFLKGRE